jgi:chromosome partitioning protein
MKVIAIANQKGGVGKTTLTREISACCALRGYQVLMVDCDPQGNLTASWVDEDVYENTLAHVLIEPEALNAKKREPISLDYAILEAPIENLDLVPADIRLARFEQQPNYMDHRLRNQLIEHGQEYDLVFIDCPPQLGKLLTAAMYASEYVIIPCAADAMGLQGLSDLAYTIEQIKKNVNANLKLLGAVVNLFKPQRNISAEARQTIEQEINLVGYVFDTNVHDYAKIAEAPSQHLPIALYAPDHRASDLLASLTDEVLDRLKMPRQKMVAVKNTKKGDK